MVGRRDWIAVRRLRVEGSAATLIVRLAAPELVARGEWRCRFQIAKGRRRVPGDAFGIDAFQALVMALAGIRKALDSYGLTLTWEGGDPGDTGFTRLVPQAFGLPFVRRVEQLIESEERRFARAAIRRGS